MATAAKPKNKIPVRCVVELPSELGEAVDGLAREIRVSRNKAAAALIRMGIKFQAERSKKLKEITKKIREAPTDKVAEQYDEELLELMSLSPRADR